MSKDIVVDPVRFVAGSIVECVSLFHNRYDDDYEYVFRVNGDEIVRFYSHRRLTLDGFERAESDGC